MISDYVFYFSMCVCMYVVFEHMYINVMALSAFLL